LAPAYDIDEAGAVMLFARAGGVAVADRQAELRYGRAGGRVAQIRIARQVAHQEYFVQRNHRLLLSGRGIYSIATALSSTASISVSVSVSSTSLRPPRGDS